MNSQPKETIIICSCLTGFTCDLDGSYCVMFNGVSCNPKEKKKELKCKK